MAWAALATACRPEPQSRLTVCPGTSTGRPGQQRGHAGDVPVVFARLVGAAEDHIVDPVGRKGGAVEQAADRGRGEVVGADLGERAAGAADRGADGVEDVGVGHGGSMGAR